MQEDRNLLQQIKERFEIVKEKKDLEKLRLEAEKLKEASSQPDFWADNQTAQKTMQTLGEIESEISNVESLEQRIIDTLDMSQDVNDSDIEMSEMINEETSNLAKELDSLELSTFLSGKFDKNNAFFKIYAGQGGTEAMDWADILFRMYTRFFTMKNWKITIIEKLDGTEAGIQTVTVLVQGRYAYGYLKHENGTHRLVRNSPFNSAGLRQTSFAGVEVLPEVNEDVDIELNEAEIEFSAVRSSGAGGQSVNKTASKVRLLHKPTGIAVESSVHKTQSQNRKEAENLLKARLYELEEKKRNQQIQNIKGEYKVASWGNQIRNYVFSPYQLVKDLRTGIETSNIDSVMNGNIQEFIDAEIKML